MENKVIILVHPFDSDVYETQDKYLAKRNKIIRGDSELVVLTREGDRTANRLGNRKAKILKTPIEANPTPEIGWKAFSEYIGKYFQAVFCGAELHFNSNGQPYTGCVLEAFERTDVSNKIIDRNACWISK